MPIEAGYINCAHNATGYEGLSHGMVQDNAYMTICSTNDGDTSEYYTTNNMTNTENDKIEKDLVQLETTLKRLKLIFVILGIAIVAVSVTFGVLIHIVVSRVLL